MDSGLQEKAGLCAERLTVWNRYKEDGIDDEYQGKEGCEGSKKGGVPCVMKGDQT